jgi:carboxypeptidase C (cathepsin A)
MKTCWTRPSDGTFNGRPLRYDFSLRLASLQDDQGQALGTASVFSYVADLPESEREARPVVFAFNGGPGSASAYLHLGGLGPWRVDFPTDLRLGLSSPPPPLRPNPHALLDTADLVFIDPIQTGFGRAAPQAAAAALYSVLGDAAYFADIICQWLRLEQRLSSPKYLLGESYGTQRAVFLADRLLNTEGITLEGLVLLGQAVNVQETLDRHGNLAGALAGFAFQATTAWFHGRSAHRFDSADAVTEAALAFAYGPYAQALLHGQRLESADMQAMAQSLQGWTGVAADVYLRHRLWLTKEGFLQELQREQGLGLGRCDARYTAPEADIAAGEAQTDPSMDRTRPGFVAAVASHLGSDPEAVATAAGSPAAPGGYRLRDDQAGAAWTWRETPARGFMRFGQASPFETYPYVSRLTQFMRQAPAARLFIGTGLYDSLTTVGAAEHLLRHYDIPLGRAEHHRYPAGHMMYTDPAVCRQLMADLRGFVSAVPVAEGTPP